MPLTPNFTGLPRRLTLLHPLRSLYAGPPPGTLSLLAPSSEYITLTAFSPGRDSDENMRAVYMGSLRLDAFALIIPVTAHPSKLKLSWSKSRF